MKILVDVDDVINDLCETWIAYLNGKHQLDAHINEMEEWDINKIFPTLSKDQIYEPLQLEEFWDNVTLMSGADAGINLLRQDGHEVYLCTSTYYKTILPKFERMFKLLKFTHITWDNVIIASDKSMINADIIIDDYIDNIRNSKCKYKLLFSKPYNLVSDDGADYLRVRSWEGIIMVIRAIAYAERADSWMILS